MKYTIYLFVMLLLASCRENSKPATETAETPEAVEELSKAEYPEALDKVFDAHGGLQLWRSMKSLVYEIPKGDFNEVHTINLHSRKDRVETPAYSMGFDGKDVWILDPDGTYEGDPVFYHNLMFYFYAMPFVLADDGIIYKETEDLVFEGKNYPGIAIGYQDNVGTTPKDEYFIHFDPDTNRMSWLGYTVTYRTGEKSENVKWIRYGDWQETQGVLLPKALTWYDYDERTIKEPKNTVLFENASLDTEAKGDDVFEMPSDAEIALSKMPSS